MRKLVLGLALLTVFIGCKDNDDETTHPCRYNEIVSTLHNVQQIDNRTISLVRSTECLDLIFKYYNNKEFVIYESNLNLHTSIRLYGLDNVSKITMYNDDTFEIDSLNIKFTCVHR